MAAAAEVLAATPDLTLEELGEKAGIGNGTIARLTDLLLAAKVIEQRAGRLRLMATDFDPTRISLASEERRKAYEASRVEMMRGYAECRSCRRRYILNYFGEEYEPDRCGLCDRDVEKTASISVAIQPEDSAHPLVAFGIGDRVDHNVFGEGTIQRIEGDALVVLFETAGYKMLSARSIVERRLLGAKRQTTGVKRRRAVRG